MARHVPNNHIRRLSLLPQCYAKSYFTCGIGHKRSTMLEDIKKKEYKYG
jgi:hypothetical protein